MVLDVATIDSGELEQKALAALAHDHRLSVFRMLVEAGPAGLNAGTIASKLRIPPSSLTFHIQNLHRAGLVMPIALSM